jgi:hypothetical protein
MKFPIPFFLIVLSLAGCASVDITVSTQVGGDKDRAAIRCTACNEKNNQKKWNGELHARIVEVECYNVFHDSLINTYGL